MMERFIHWESSTAESHVMEIGAESDILPSVQVTKGPGVVVLFDPNAGGHQWAIQPRLFTFAYIGGSYGCIIRWKQGHLIKLVAFEYELRRGTSNERLRAPSREAAMLQIINQDAPDLVPHVQRLYETYYLPHGVLRTDMFLNFAAWCKMPPGRFNKSDFLAMELEDYGPEVVSPVPLTKLGNLAQICSIMLELQERFGLVHGDIAHANMVASKAQPDERIRMRDGVVVEGHTELIHLIDFGQAQMDLRIAQGVGPRGERPLRFAGFTRPFGMPPWSFFLRDMNSEITKGSKPIDHLDLAHRGQDFDMWAVGIMAIEQIVDVDTMRLLEGDLRSHRFGVAGYIESMADERLLSKKGESISAYIRSVLFGLIFHTRSEGLPGLVVLLKRQSMKGSIGVNVLTTYVTEVMKQQPKDNALLEARMRILGFVARGDPAVIAFIDACIRPRLGEYRESGYWNAPWVIIRRAFGTSSK